MTALLSRNGTNFTLACDGCGHQVVDLVDLADRVHHWDLAWAEQCRHGWTGAALATGPHICPRCAQTPATAHGTEQMPGDARSVPVRRHPKRITVTDLPLATVVTVRGALSIAVNMALYALLLSNHRPRRHVIVDLSSASTLNSGVLDVLVRAQAHMTTSSFDLCPVGLSRPMHDALRLLCLADLLPTFAHRSQALAWLHDRAVDRLTPPRHTASDEWAAEAA